jgi:hypothetical protein
MSAARSQQSAKLTGMCTATSVAGRFNGVTHVAIPENMRMPTSVQVEVMPSADEKDRNRKGTKDVGMILQTQAISMAQGCGVPLRSQRVR